MPMVRCKPAAGWFPTPRVPRANMGDPYHIDADGIVTLSAMRELELLPVLFTLPPIRRWHTFWHYEGLMKASFRSSLLSAYYNSVTESPWMLWNDLFQRFVYRGIFFSRPPSTSGTAIVAKFHPPSVAPWTDVILTKKLLWLYFPRTF